MPRIRLPQTSSVLRANAAGGGVWAPCLLTWYDPALGGDNSWGGVANPHGATASGEPYDANKDTCAAPPSYSFGTMLTFEYQGSQVTCKVNDRGGAIQGSHFDLSRSAAQKLNIISAGKVNARFMVGGSSGAPAPPNTGSGAASGGSGSGGFDLLTVLGDLLSGNLQDLGVQMALAMVGIAKDLGLGVVDFLVIPWWHWNQRATDYYVTQELFAKDKNRWDVLPWTAAFWGLGYWLFWTDPDSKGLKPAPVRNSRIARHARALQSLPARRGLIKPKDVTKKTPKKPKPVPSRAAITSTGTMTVTRNVPVTVSGGHADRSRSASETSSETRIEPTGTIGTEPEKPGKETLRSNSTAKPDAKHRTGAGSLPHSGRNPEKGST